MLARRLGICMLRLVVLVALMAATSAMAEGSSAGYEKGGPFDRFDPVVMQYNQSGELFRIVGPCRSACTLFLGIKNVCIDPGAELMFHAGQDGQHHLASRHLSHDAILQRSLAQLSRGHARDGVDRLPRHLRARHDRQVRLPRVSGITVADCRDAKTKSRPRGCAGPA
jgi:hypothetical protein